MTEREWAACGDHRPMLAHLFTARRPGGRVTERALRLYACACCRVIWDVLPEDEGRRAVEAAERYADGGDPEEVAVAHELLNCLRVPLSEAGCWARMAAFYASLDPGDRPRSAGAKGAALAAALWTPWEVVRAVEPARRHDSARRMSDLLRDVVGDLFRRVGVDPAWLTWDVTALARGVYEQRKFDLLPILADALEDAGCADEAVLRHCRSGGPHTRGCWLGDLLNGRENDGR